MELYKTKIDNDVFNNSIYNLAVLLEKNKDKYNDNLPITVNPYAFTSKDEEIQKKWKRPIPNWNKISIQLAELFGERYTKYLEI